MNLNKMENMDFLMDIPLVKRGCQFWMIRTNDGLFFDEYINQGFIAIGWNSITKNTFPLSKEGKQALKIDLKGHYGSQVPGSAINKCEKFCMKLKPGDIAVITGKEQIAFAEIGEYYEENREIYNESLELEVNEKIKRHSSDMQEIAVVEDKESVNKGFFLDPQTGQSSLYEIPVRTSRGTKKQNVLCPYCKRRKIKLLSLVHNRETINPYLYKAILLNNHSLSSLNKYADAILSSCYDIYLWRGNLWFALKVDTRKSINAVTLSSFIHSFADLLPTVQKEDISVKTALHSPGDIVLQVANWLSNANNYLWVFLILMFCSVVNSKTRNFLLFGMLSNILLNGMTSRHPDYCRRNTNGWKTIF